MTAKNMTDRIKRNMLEKGLRRLLSGPPQLPSELTELMTPESLAKAEEARQRSICRTAQKGPVVTEAPSAGRENA